ncbi:Complex I assembly factor TIMMDC1, mitochondrial [Varanus komodoensis]|uniref:Complex I assembly factor TIMMDC1, mitochondrial n=1 Tax=Varanus komodoensis TaxID=61221 RepID=A0A8D2L7K4_VARKO|nr:complex I assembly factor TIMMDC1, mitochondrial [Varanus komodoensis]KAF7250997.1 Complex I assembly factor TIMMDC1, mitochondrial [Varanus komodoensis]
MERPPKGPGAGLLPLVWAEESVGSAAAAPQPSFLGQPEPPRSGWERLRAVFRRDEQKQYPEEILNIFKATFSGSIIGLFYGGIPGFLYAKRRYIEQSEGTIYYNHLDAVRSVHQAAMRGFIRYGFRWSWRVAAFVAIFNTVSTVLSVYRDKIVISHFAIAGACTGGLFRMHLGLRGLTGGSIFGALLGIPAGGLLMAMQSLSGETLVERRKREQRERYEQNLAEWDAKLRITENISEEAGKNSPDFIPQTRS